MAALAEIVPFLEEAAESAAKWKGAYDVGRGALQTIYGAGKEVYDDVNKGINWVEGEFAGAKRRRTSSGPRRPVPLKPLRPPSRRNSKNVIMRKKLFTMGRYIGNVGRMRRIPTLSKLAKSSIRHHYEETATVNHADVVQVGHGAGSPRYVLFMFAMSLIKRLWRWGKIENIDDTPVIASENFQYALGYRLRPELGVTHGTPVTFGVGLSFRTMGKVMAEAMTALWTTTDNHIVFDYIRLIRLDGVAIEHVHEINLRSARFVSKFTSMMTVQNVTQSNSGGTDDHSLTTDVRRNPLSGRIFTTNSNCLIAHNDDAAALADDFTGSITPVARTRVESKHYYSNASGSKLVKIGPGEIKKSNLVFTFNGTVNMLFRRLSNYVEVNTAIIGGGYTNRYVPFGRHRILMFEHMVKNSSDPDCTLGVERNLWAVGVLVGGTQKSTTRLIS